MCCEKEASYISKNNKQKRLQFARKNIHWGEGELAKILWSDESTSELFPGGIQDYENEGHEIDDGFCDVCVMQHDVTSDFPFICVYKYSPSLWNIVISA